MMKSSVPIKRISRIFDNGDLRSVHFCDLHIVGQWAKNQLRYIYSVASLFESGIISYRTVVDNSSKNLHCLPLERSFEVIRSHQPLFANNAWSKRDRDVILVSVRSSWPGESNNMQYNPFRSSRDLGLTWPEVKLWPWPFKVILYMVGRALTRQTRWYQIRCSTFKIKYFLSKNRFGKFWNFDPWWPQFWPEPKNDRNEFEMIFRELSNPVFLFSLRRPGAEIMGRGRSNALPPAGGGKSRGPAGRGLSYWDKN